MFFLRSVFGKARAVLTLSKALTVTLFLLHQSKKKVYKTMIKKVLFALLLTLQFTAMTSVANAALEMPTCYPCVAVK